MDFGNCRKSMFAHNDSIMSVNFVKNTHYFFSASKDRIIKYWDGDTYELVLDFDCHLAEVWALAVSSIGDFFVSASNDKSVRIWQQTKDQVFIIEEEEKRQEKTMVDNYAKEKMSGNNMNNEGNDNMVVAKEVDKFRIENLKFGENVIVAIETAEKLRDDYIQYEIELQEYQKASSKQKRMMEEPKKPDMQQLGGLSIPEYVFKAIGKIKMNELENSLKFLHFTHMEKLLSYLKYYIENNINIELSTRILYFILQTHEGHIRNSGKLMKLLASIQRKLKKQLEKEQNLIGFNVSALKLIQNKIKLKKEEENIAEDDLFKTRTSFM